MCIYYIIHNITKAGERNDENIDRAARNCRTFMFGTMIYIVLYMLLKHLSLTNKFIYSILMSGFALMFMADIAVMAFLYKIFYGRFITNEVLSNDEDDAEWKYDEKTHKYKRKTDADYRIENELENAKADYYSKKINEMREELNNKCEIKPDVPDNNNNNNEKCMDGVCPLKN